MLDNYTCQKFKYQARSVKLSGVGQQDIQLIKQYVRL